MSDITYAHPNCFYCQGWENEAKTEANRRPDAEAAQVGDDYHWARYYKDPAQAPTHGWVPDESETEMNEHETLTAVKTDNLVQLLLQQLSEHQRARPFDPDNVGEPPAYEIARMDDWQRMESALLTVLGARLAYLAMDQWQEATA